MFILLAFLLASSTYAQDHDKRASDRRGDGPERVDLVLDADQKVTSAAVTPASKAGVVFEEDFDDLTAFPPAGWTTIHEGTAGAGTEWGLFTDGEDPPNQYAGSVDALGAGPTTDYLVTPLLEVSASNSTVTFQMAQAYNSDYGSIYEVAVSTGAQDDASDFVTVASWNESTACPGATAPPSGAFDETCVVDLSAYNGQEVYVAFVHSQDYYDNFYLDNVTGPPEVVADAPPECAVAFDPADDATGVMTGTVPLNWSASDTGASPTGYLLDVGTDNPPTNIAEGADVGGNTSVSMVASYSTTYYYRVTPYNGAGQATGCPVVSFTTEDPLTPPYTETFATYPPSRWTEAYGTLPANGEVTFVNNDSYWEEGDFANSGFGSNAATINLWYGSDGGYADWMLSPYIDLGDGSTAYQVSFDAALTEWDETTPGSFDEDDRFAVVISDDGGQTWNAANVVFELTSADASPGAGTSYVVDLDGYSGIVQLGFYAESTGGTADTDLFLDNVEISELVDPNYGALPGDYFFATSLADDVHAQAYAQPGVVPVDISDTGTNITAELGDDDREGPYDLGFSFSFYGESFTQVWIGSNGWISMGGDDPGTTTLSNVELPDDTDDISGFIAWAWDDLDPTDDSPGNTAVYVGSATIDGETVWVAQFERYPEFGADADGWITAQIILVPVADANGKIRLQYLDAGSSFDMAGLTVGMESPDGTMGFTYNVDGTGGPLFEDGRGVGPTPLAKDLTVSEDALALVIGPDASALPVELAGFDAMPDGAGTVDLAWQTAREDGTAGFYVEHRRTDAEAWTEAGFVPGAGTTAEARAYSFRAEGLAPGTYQFRLRQVDTDGTEHLSAKVEAVVGMSEALLLEGIAPNPSAGRFAATFAASEAGTARVSVYDALGREVAVLHDGTVPAGESVTVRLDEVLPSGVYFVRLVTERGVRGQTVTVVR